MIEPEILAELNLNAIESNFEEIARRLPGLKILPMIKSNGYGHGALAIAKVLEKKTSLAGFGVAAQSEALELRHNIRSTRILLFQKAVTGAPANKIYVRATKSRLLFLPLKTGGHFALSKGTAILPYHLKFNTGMNRLGIPLAALEEVRRDLTTLPENQRPEGVLTHLAEAESPNSRLSRLQKKNWEKLLSALRSLLPRTQFHLGNSSAIWNAKSWDLESTQWVRPGVALYGIPPWKGARARELQLALNLRARILQKQLLKPGDSIGYGGKFRVPLGGRPVHVAILRAGYADGLVRALTNTDPFLGIVSMDLSAVRSNASAKVGDWVQLLGEGVDPWKRAIAAKTIPYELYTSISARVSRTFIGGSSD